MAQFTIRRIRNNESEIKKSKRADKRGRLEVDEKLLAFVVVK